MIRNDVQLESIKQAIALLEQCGQQSSHRATSGELARSYFEQIDQLKLQSLIYDRLRAQEEFVGPEPPAIPAHTVGTMLGDVGYALFCARKTAGFTQSELASRLGIAQSAVARLESTDGGGDLESMKASPPSVNQVRRWSEACGYSFLSMLVRRSGFGSVGSMTELFFHALALHYFTGSDQCLSERVVSFARQLRIVCNADSVTCYRELRHEQTRQSEIRMMWFDGLKHRVDHISHNETLAVIDRLACETPEYRRVDDPNTQESSEHRGADGREKSIVVREGIRSFFYVPLVAQGERAIIFINYCDDRLAPSRRFTESLKELRRIVGAFPELVLSPAMPELQLSSEPLAPPIAHVPDRREWAKNLLVRLRQALGEEKGHRVVMTVHEVAGPDGALYLKPMSAYPQIPTDDERRHDLFGADKSMVRLAYEACPEPVYAKDLADPQWQGVYQVLWGCTSRRGVEMRSEVTVSIRWDPQKPIRGVLNVESPIRDDFSEEDIKLIKVCARALALVLDEDHQIDAKRHQARVLLNEAAMRRQAHEVDKQP